MDKTAAQTLEDVSRGGQKLIAIALKRLGEAQTALTEGRFTDAFERVQEAEGKIGPLAAAQANMTPFAHGVVRASEVEPGMSLLNWGEVSDVSVETITCASGDHTHEIVTLHLKDGQQQQVDGDQELFLG